MHEYHNSIQDPEAVAALFAQDGAIELPYLASIGAGWRTVGPADIRNMIAGILKMAPEFKFINIKFYIETPDQVFAEYEVDCTWNGKPYKQMYMGRLVAENGKIKLVREAMNMHSVLQLG